VKTRGSELAENTVQGAVTVLAVVVVVVVVRPLEAAALPGVERTT